MPVSIRNSEIFKTEILRDSLLLYILSIFSLFTGIWYVFVLLEIVGYYYGGFRAFQDSGISIYDAFWIGTAILGGIFALLSITTVLLVGVGLLISKNLPLTMRAYVEITLQTKGEAKMTDALIDKAHNLHQLGEANEAVLHATTAVDYELRRLFNVRESYSFSLITSKVADSGITSPTKEEIIKLITIRNEVTGATSGKTVHSQDARAALNIANILIKNLRDKYFSLGYTTLQQL